jgi:hypothetical protein
MEVIKNRRDLVMLIVAAKPNVAKLGLQGTEPRLTQVCKLSQTADVNSTQI